MAQPVVHFEIPADNPERLSRFYADLFGWRIETWSGPMQYTLLYTKGPKGVGIDGGMYKRTLPDQRPINYVNVRSASEYAQKAVPLGGRLIVPRTEIPSIGWYAIVTDPEGNTIGLFEPAVKAAQPKKRARRKKPAAKKAAARKKTTRKPKRARARR